MYTREYQRTHDIDWFFIAGDTPIHLASNGGILPEIYNAVKLQTLQSKVQSLEPSHDFILNRSVLDKMEFKMLNDQEQRLYIPQGLNYDTDTPAWMKAYSWSFAEMARRGFYSFDRDPITNSYFLVAFPADNGRDAFNKELMQMLHKVPQNDMDLYSIDIYDEEPINWVGIVNHCVRRLGTIKED